MSANRYEEGRAALKAVWTRPPAQSREDLRRWVRSPRMGRLLDLARMLEAHERQGLPLVDTFFQLVRDAGCLPDA